MRRGHGSGPYSGAAARLARALRRCLLIAALCALASAPAARADEADAVRMRSLADRVAATWVPAQRADGWFLDPVTRFYLGGYGLDMIGHALLRTGTRTGDAAAVAAGRRAVVAAADAPDAPGAFAILARAVTLTQPEADAALDEPSRSALLRSLGRFVKPRVGARAQACSDRPSCYSNLKLVDATATLRLLETGAPVLRRDSRLARPAKSRQEAERLLGRWLPGVMDFGARLLLAHGTVRGAAVMSDPRQYPLAYHSLSAAMYAHALADLGARATRGERHALRAALDGLTGIVAPDGELSWMGRGDGQVWVPAAALYAATTGARMFRADAARAARYRAVAAAMLAVLEGRAPAPGQVGFRLVPDAERRTGYAGIDHYANAVTYNGLALFFLDLAADAARAAPAARGALPSQRSRLAFADPRASGVAAVRHDGVWFAVHDAQTHPTDLRYDFGLLRLKVLGGDGRWTDLLERRPLTEGAGVVEDSAGPVLLTRGGPALPEGRLSVDRSGTVRIRGGWRRAGRLVRRATFTFAPRAAGVSLHVTGVHAGDRLRMLAFTAGAATTGRRQLSAGALKLRVSEDLSRVRTLPGGFASATAEQLAGYELIARVRRARTFTVSWTRRSAEQPAS